MEHTGDNLTGEGEGDDRVIKVNLAAVPGEAERIVFTVSIYEAEQREQNFGQVRNAYIRILNQADSSEIARYDLTEEASTETAMMFGEVYRHAGSGSSAPSGRATAAAWPVLPATSGSTSRNRPRRQRA